MCNVCGIHHGTEYGNSSTPVAAVENMRHIPLANIRGNMAKCIFCSLFINMLQHFYPDHANWTLPALGYLEMYWMNDKELYSLGAPLGEGIVRLHPSYSYIPPQPIIEVYGFNGTQALFPIAVFD